MKYTLYDQDVKIYNCKDFGNNRHIESKINLNIPNMSTFQVFDPNHDYSYLDNGIDDIKIWDPTFNHKS